MRKPIEDRITSAFTRYKAIYVFLENLVTSQHFPNELVILTCARLDALANLAITQSKSQRDRFVSFISTYSSKRRELEKIALPNLYSRLNIDYSTLSGTIPKPGRIHSYDEVSDSAFIRFIVESGLSITEKDIGLFLNKFSIWIQNKYRTTMTQSKTKPLIDTEKNIMEYLLNCSKKYQKGTPEFNNEVQHLGGRNGLHARMRGYGNELLTSITRRPGYPQRVSG